MRSTTLTAAEAGDAVVFDNDALIAGGAGVNVQSHNHTVTVETEVTTYDVDIRIGGQWIRIEDGTDVAAAVATVLDQVGFDAVKVTCTQPGDVTLTHWRTV